jgi:DNA-binding transcriptional ArsR family regulator
MRSKHGRKADRTGRSAKSSPFLMVHHHVLTSPGWRSLSATARTTFLVLWARATPGRNGFVVGGVRELATATGHDKNTVSRALTELRERGWIEAVEHGTFRRRDRRATEWRVCLLFCDRTKRAADKTCLARGRDDPDPPA